MDYIIDMPGKRLLESPAGYALLSKATKPESNEHITGELTLKALARRRWRRDISLFIDQIDHGLSFSEGQVLAQAGEILAR